MLPLPAPINTVRDALHQPIFGLAASDYDLLEMEQRDSKDIDDTYMQQLVQHVATANHPNILVTFGTDALLRAAEAMHQAIAGWAAAGHDKTVILTGSMLPLANGSASDGWQNLQLSIDLLLGRQGNPCQASVSMAVGIMIRMGGRRGRNALAAAAIPLYPQRLC
jgi:L-asparaginase/Glu-tRNA(Gln) amidotransferase subunit D